MNKVRERERERERKRERERERERETIHVMKQMFSMWPSSFKSKEGNLYAAHTACDIRNSSFGDFTRSHRAT